MPRFAQELGPDLLVPTQPLGHRAWPLSVAIALVAVLLGVLYASVLKELALAWWQNPDYSHGFIVPVFVGYVLWRERRRYQALQVEPRSSGLLVIVASMALLIVGTLGADLFTTRFSFVVLLAGLVAYLAGWRMLRALSFPLSYLTLMIPLPALIYNEITFPLQMLASRMAAKSLEVLQTPVLREGNLLRVPNFGVEVIDACSGIRSLASLIALAIALVYLAERRWWARIALTLLMLPIAILCNTLRVVVTCQLGYRVGPEWAEGFLHQFSGWLVFVLAILFMLLFQALLIRVGQSRKQVHS